MKKITCPLILTLALAIAATRSSAADAVPDAAALTATSNIVAAANVFLATLDDQQRAAVLYKFDDEKQRARWSNFPTGFVHRGGLSLADLTDAQQKAVLALLAVTLSQDGYDKVEAIRQADEVFKTTPQSAARRRQQ